MKRTVCVLISLFLMSCNFALNGQDEAQNKKVRSVTVYHEKFDMLVARKYKELEQNFDTRGNLLEEITYKQGKVSKHFKYQYDSENNKIKEEEFDPAGRIIEISEYKYEDGLRKEKTVIDANKKMKSRKTYQYVTF